MKKTALFLFACLLVALVVFAQPASIICKVTRIVVQRDSRVALADINCQPFKHVQGNIYEYQRDGYTFTYDRVLGNLTVSPGLLVTGDLTTCNGKK